MSMFNTDSATARLNGMVSQVGFTPDDFWEVIAMAREAIKEVDRLKEQSRWRDVRVELPEKTTWALCHGDGAVLCYAWNMSTQRWEDWAGITHPGLHVSDITHWQPITPPEAP